MPSLPPFPLPLPTEHSAYAVVVGVQDYSAYDASTGRSPGTTNLRAPNNDLRDFLAQLERVGFAREDVRVLSDDPELAEGLADGVPTAANIRAAVEELGRLNDKLWVNRIVFYFAGHGIDDGDRLLCGSDLAAAGSKLEGTIALEEISAILNKRSRAKGAHLFIDCCFAGVDLPTEVALPTRSEINQFLDGDIILTAGGADQASIELKIDGAWRGAFTWTMCRAMERIVRIDIGGANALDLSYTDLTWRMKNTCAALSIPHEPQFSGDFTKRGHAVFQILHGPALPTLQRLTDQADRQIWPGENGLIYKICQNANGTGSLFGYLEASTGATAKDAWFKMSSGPAISSLGSFHLVPTSLSTIPGGTVHEGSFDSFAFPADMQSNPPVVNSAQAKVWEVFGVDDLGESTSLGWFQWSSSGGPTRWWLPSAVPTQYKRAISGNAFYLDTPSGGALKLVSCTINNSLDEAYFLSCDTSS